MRFLTVLLFTFLILFTSSSPAQTTDSLQRAIEQAGKTLETTTNDFSRLQDSLKETPLRRTIDKNSQSMDAFLQEMKEREKEKRQQTYIRIGLGTLFLIVLVTGLARRRKLRKQS